MIVADKSTWRRAIIQARNGRSPAHRAIDDAQLAGQLRSVLAERQPSVVAAYLPFGNEPGGPGLLTAGFADVSCDLLLPIVRGVELDWAHYTGPADLRQVGRCWEPTGPRLGSSALARADLILVPAFAVDRHGTRLGRGAGFYDRALGRLRATAGQPSAVDIAAIVYDDELVAELPRDDHDVAVSAVLTPKNGWQPRPVSDRC